MFFKRKLLASIYTSIIFTFVYLSFFILLGTFWISGDSYETNYLTAYLGYVPFILFYTLIGNIIYGLPVSILASYLTTKLPYRGILQSVIIHYDFWNRMWYPNLFIPFWNFLKNTYNINTLMGYFMKPFKPCLPRNRHNRRIIKIRIADPC